MQSCSQSISYTGRSAVSHNQTHNNKCKYNSCVDMGNNNNTSTIEFTPNNSMRVDDQDLSEKLSCRVRTNRKQNNT